MKSEKSPSPATQKRTIPLPKKGTAWRFESLDALILACREINKIRNIGETNKSSAYRSGNGDYYLFLAQTPPEQILCVCEFGKAENSDVMLPILSEYGNCICPADAVRILAEL